MKKIVVFILAAFSFLGCASVPEADTADYSDEMVLIQVKGPGVAPTGNGVHDSIEFQVLAGTGSVPEKWLLEILNDRDVSVRDLSGKGEAPELWSWDGLNSRGRAVPDGRYRARISVWFPGMTDPIVQETAEFVVDTTGPEGSLAFSEGLFSPDDDGVNDTLGISVTVSDSLSDVQSWTLGIYDSHDALIKQFYSSDGDSERILWDGTDGSVPVVDSAADYRAVLTSTDTLGNESVTEGLFETDILVLKEGDIFRIRINSITFKPYEADFLDVESERRDSNLEALDLLAEKLKKFPGYKITVEGHAVSVFWNNAVKAEKENREVLMPLSESRARIVMEALQERGVDALAMDYIGIGANRPIVPFADLQNRWKNRRVVFILAK